MILHIERLDAVVTMSKILKMKAIHNCVFRCPKDFCAVVTMSKILKMKAIHNLPRYSPNVCGAVVTMSKILKMKAIHNWHTRAFCRASLL